MVELDCWLWESLYTVKQMYDHGCADQILTVYGNDEIDSDMVFEIACDGIGQIFEDTRNYCNDSAEIETYVFFDSMITDFYRLCEEYERKTKCSVRENSYRAEMKQAICNGFAFQDYSYDFEIHTDPQGHSGCKLVLLLSPEFCCHYQVPNGLLDIRDAFTSGTERLRRELGKLECEKVVALPIPENMEERRAA